MKKLIVVTLAMIIGFISYGNDSDEKKLSSEDKIEFKVEYYKIVLELNEQQVVKLKPILIAHNKKVIEIKDKYKPIRDEMKSELKRAKENSSQGKGNPESPIKAKYKEALAPMKDDIKAAKVELNQKMMKILNKDQAVKFQQLVDLEESKRKRMEKSQGQQYRPKQIK